MDDRICDTQLIQRKMYTSHIKIIVILLLYSTAVYTMYSKSGLCREREFMPTYVVIFFSVSTYFFKRY